MKDASSGLRVLIVDDFEPVRRRLAQMLADEPDVTIAGQSASVREAMEAIRSLAPDVVTLDLGLPDGNGLEVLRRTRHDNPRPVFIVLTNHAVEAYRNEASKQEAHAFLDKTREFDKAVELIRCLAAPRSANPSKELS